MYNLYNISWWLVAQPGFRFFAFSVSGCSVYGLCARVGPLLEVVCSVVLPSYDFPLPHEPRQDCNDGKWK